VAFTIIAITTGVIDVTVIKTGIIGTIANSAVEPSIAPVICNILFIVPYNLTFSISGTNSSKMIY